MTVSRVPQITTIVPTYRRPALLKRAVLSVLNQSFSDFIVQILDNASGDATGDVASELMRTDGRIRYHRQPENVGAVRNIIHGMDGVSTPYFNVLCDDDLLMPDFFANALRIHEAGGGQLAFVSTRVVVLDETGHFSAPFAHPAERCRFAAPDGMARCLMTGVSLPGVMYRTAAIREIGPPRTAWWNWTESGWHALAGIRAPIEFSPEVGAIMCDHAAGGSKQMDCAEFRISWFKMLADVRSMAVRSGVTDTLWKRRIRTHQYAKFVSTCLRISGEDDANAYEELREAGIRSGMSTWVVASALAVARLIRQVGAGSMLNRAIDWTLHRRATRVRTAGAPSVRQADAGIESASHVFAELSAQAGVAR